MLTLAMTLRQERREPRWVSLLPLQRIVPIVRNLRQARIDMGAQGAYKGRKRVGEISIAPLAIATGAHFDEAAKTIAFWIERDQFIALDTGQESGKPGVALGVEGSTHGRPVVTGNPPEQLLSRTTRFRARREASSLR